MTKRLVVFGGTDFADEGLIPDDLNDTIAEAATSQIDVMAQDTTLFTTQSVTFVTKITKTFTPDSSNNLLLGVKLETDLRVSGGGGSSVARVTISDGVNTWKGMVSNTASNFTQNSGYKLFVTDTSFATVSQVFMINDTFVVDIDDLQRFAGFNAMGGAASYTVKVELGSSNITSNNAQMDNTTVTLFYMEGGIVTVDSAKFT